jgi:3-methyl-2-oxobutanoate hydroxymethyltransferase
MNELIEALLRKKRQGSPVTMVTAYDYPVARIASEAGMDVILVGDSVGTNVLGYGSECEVTIDDMVHHLKAVKRGAPEKCVMVDLPYGTADTSDNAFTNASTLVAAGAHIVKLEGWGEKREIVTSLSEKGIAVCAHIGYNAQYHGPKGRMFGKDVSGAIELIESATSLEQAGAVMLIVEKIPAEIARVIRERLSIPVIGIGSGGGCDGQVLVVHDIIGLGWRTFRHARQYLDLGADIADAFCAYIDEIESGAFPAEEHTWHLPADVLAEVRKKLS